MEKNKVIAFIPVRSGSKRIPGKNTKEIGGRPLVFWTLDAAMNCELIDLVVISTDSDDILELIMHEYNTVVNYNKLIFILRSDETASDQATTESAMLEFFENSEIYTGGNKMNCSIVLIQATSPLTTTIDLHYGIELHMRNNRDDIVSGILTGKFAWKINQVNPLRMQTTYDLNERTAHGNFINKSFLENGAFYITTYEKLIKSKLRVSGNILPFPMQKHTIHELDDPSDWPIVEELLIKHKKAQKTGKDLYKINSLISDVDGTLTDATFEIDYIQDKGRRYNKRDGHGISMLKSALDHVYLLSKSKGDDIEARAKALNVVAKTMVIDKKEWVKRWMREYNLIVAYIGDDVNDLEAMKLAYWTACPADAHPEVKKVVDYICENKGGHGAVREVCDLILEAKKRTYTIDA